MDKQLSIDKKYLIEGRTREGYKKARDGFWRKIKKEGERIPFIKDAIALYRYMVDPKVAWYKKSVAIAVLLYFITPWDAIPDFLPVVGYLDDAGVLAAAVGYYANELNGYYKNVNKAKSRKG